LTTTGYFAQAGNPAAVPVRSTGYITSTAIHTFVTDESEAAAITKLDCGGRHDPALLGRAMFHRIERGKPDRK
jgi:hypothetical protein